MIIQHRHKMLVNTDPQRRCYNGCHYKSELVWSQWEDLVLNVTKETAESKLNFWRELNDYAISQRGESARSEYRIKPEQMEMQNA